MSLDGHTYVYVSVFLSQRVCSFYISFKSVFPSRLWHTSLSLPRLLIFIPFPCGRNGQGRVSSRARRQEFWLGCHWGWKTYPLNLIYFLESQSQHHLPRALSTLDSNNLHKQGVKYLQDAQGKILLGCAWIGRPGLEGSLYQSGHVQKHSKS